MPGDAQGVTVPLSLFSSLNTELSPPDIPEGISPDNADVMFLPGSVFSRWGMHKLYPQLSLGATSVYIKTYVQPNGNPLNLRLDSDGVFWQEDVSNAPGVLVKVGQFLHATVAQSCTAFFKEYIAASDGYHGTDVPRQYDGTNVDRVTQDGPGAPLAAVDSGTAGSIPAGVHQVVVMFQTRSGYITKPSAPVSWNAAGGKKVALTNIPLGPANVVARIIAFTGAGGANFFYVPVSLTIPVAISSTVINDNSSTTATLDFADNNLFAATAIDIKGRNYFANVVLGPVAGFFYYASRLFAWGERNKVQNLLNMGFEGGYLSGAPTVPLGWTVETGGGALTSGGAWSSGESWVITGDNSANPLGRISQPAFQDYLGVPVIQPITQYSFRCWAKVQDGFQGIAGTLTADLFSPGSGVIIAQANIPISSISATGKFVQADFSNQTPTILPSDVVLRVYATSQTTGQLLALDELAILFTQQPYRDSFFRASYVNAPEQFDGVTGNLGPTSDPSPIRCPFQLRNTMYFHTAKGLHSTLDNGVGEPSSWNVPAISQSCGAVSCRATDAGQVGSGESGEQFQFTISDGGVYVFAGGELLNVSQEIQSQAVNGTPGWDSITKSALNAAWIKNDRLNRRCYIGVPVLSSTTPNVIFVLDYRELADAYAIGTISSIRESFSGKMLGREFSRKWTRWTVTANCGEMLTLTGGVQEFCVGGGNGNTPGSFSGFGNSYYFDPGKLTDDDYGQIASFYATYFFVSHDQEQVLQLDSHRKLATYLSAFLSGTGNTFMVLYADTLLNPVSILPVYPLSQSQTHDLEWPINADGERIMVRIGSSPLTGQTDNSFNLQKLALTMKKHPWSGLRGAL